MKTISAAVLMCFTGFAFAQGDVMEGSKKAREEGSVPDTSIYCCEGGMAPPVEGDGEAGQLGQDPGAMGSSEENAGRPPMPRPMPEIEESEEGDEGEEQPE
ncbi:hypothetical protein OAS73_04185 [Luminiphilus sp.]|nr:hypothetical protein [Luminiphilus sp.]